MLKKQVNIDICIATFKRPELLERLLRSLVNQKTNEHKIKYNIIIVDNDKNATAKKIVDNWVEKSTIEISYCIEPQQNISLVRNRAMSLVQGDYLIFIDDDEYAAPDWLINHYETAQKYNADVVFGPVIPEYSENTPEWIKDGHFFDRERYKTGTIRPHGGTGNTMIKMQFINKMAPIFDPEFGLTGGGDTDFFWRMGNKGARMIWCDTAIVTEIVLPTRMSLKWLTRRAYRGGQMFPRVFCQNLSLFNKIFWITKRFLYLLVACCYLPIAACQGKSEWARAVQKIYTCLGHLTGFSSLYYQEYRRI